VSQLSNSESIIILWPSKTRVSKRKSVISLSLLPVCLSVRQSVIFFPLQIPPLSSSFRLTCICAWDVLRAI